MLEEKEVWDVVDDIEPKAIIVLQIKKKEENNAIAIKIIKQSVNGDFYINIISEQDPHRSLKSLLQMY